jgi:HK97 family phage prohead protease
MGSEQEWLKAHRQRQAPAWLLGDVSEWLQARAERRFVSELEPVRFEQTAVGGPVLAGRAMPYNEWSEVRSPIEGHFMESFATGAFREQVRGGIGGVRLLFEHGTSEQLGRLPLARITSLSDKPDGLYFRGELLSGIPELLLSGLRAGLFGASVRFEPIQAERVRFPQRSETNSLALPEQTVLEARLREISLTPFPIYKNTSAEIVTATA